MVSGRFFYSDWAQGRRSELLVLDISDANKNSKVFEADWMCKTARRNGLTRPFAKSMTVLSGLESWKASFTGTITMSKMSFFLYYQENKIIVLLIHSSLPNFSVTKQLNILKIINHALILILNNFPIPLHQ